MNALSDILCHSTSFSVPSSFNASNKEQANLIESLTNVETVGSTLVSISSSDIHEDVFQTSGPVHSSENSVPTNFLMSTQSTQSSQCAGNTSQTPVSFLLSNDFFKGLGDVPLSGMLPSMDEIYPSLRGNDHDRLLDVSFPPELSTINDVAQDINKSCISAGPKLMTGNATVDVISSTNSVLMTSMSHIDNSHLHLTGSKNMSPYESMKCNALPSEATITSQPIINAIMSLSEQCDITGENELLNLPLPSPINEPCLTTSVHSSVLTNRERTQSIDLVNSKLPHIALNQLDSLLGNGNSLSGIQLLQNTFSAIPIRPEVPCVSNVRGSLIDSCSSTSNITCPIESLSTSNSHSQAGCTLDAAGPLGQVTLESEINACSSFGSIIHSLVIETQCFKCKFCVFISLNKMQVYNHVKSAHLKHADFVNLMCDTGMKNTECFGAPENFSNIMSEEVREVITPQSMNVSTSLSHELTVCCNETPPKVSENIRSFPSQDTSLANSQFVCGKCNLAFACLKDCKTHLTASHNLKASYLRLESVRDKSMDTSESSANVQNCPSVGSTDSKARFSHEQNKQTPIISIRHNVANFKPNLHDPACEFKKQKQKKILNKSISTNGQKSSTNQKQVSFHKKAWKRKMKKEQGSYICEYKGCNVRFRVTDNLEYHKKCHADGSSAFICPECSIQFENWSSVANHLWNRHSNDMELHACDQCTFRTYSLSRLENLHKKIHKDEFSYLCDTCGKSFKTGKQLRNHRVIHVKHLSSTEKKVFECCICSRGIGSKKMLQYHMDNVHHKLKPFLCSHCGYSASNKGSLKLHLRQHTGEKPFSCDLCEYRTSDHNSLRRHKMKHSGEKPYKCPYCSYACIQASTYKCHLKRKHPGQGDDIMFSCAVCPFRTVNKDNFYTHITEHDLGNMSHVNNFSSSPTEIIQNRRNVLPLVEAMDISLSQDDLKMLDCPAGSDTDVGHFKNKTASTLFVVDLALNNAKT